MRREMVKSTQARRPLHLLAGFAPPAIQKKVCASVEKKKQESNKVHSLFVQKSANCRLQSRNCFLSSVHPAELIAKVERCSEWQMRLKINDHPPLYKPVKISNETEV